MRILVLQLARLGDIYQTWPVLKALRRTYSGCELHLLTRAKYAAAAPGGGWLDRHWRLDSRDVLAPLVDERPDIGESLERLGRLCDDLRATGFDLIINLSFSPFSSYLTREIALEHSVVRGYTRFDDGYLSIPDDGSAYFYAQAGPGRWNRLHVTDLFAHVAGVELCEEDWSVGRVCEPHVSPTASATVVIHVGASVPTKTLGWGTWLRIARGLAMARDAAVSPRVVLVGSSDDAEIANRIMSDVPENARVTNRVGATDLDGLFRIIAGADLLIGGDSAPVHIASLCGVPVLNISLPTVSFWETGPRSAGSRILPMSSEDAVSPDEIVREAISMLSGQPPVLGVIRVPARDAPYLETSPQPGLFEWRLISALYLGESFPPAPSELFLSGVQRLAEINVLALEQLAQLRLHPDDQTARLILERADEVMEGIARIVPAFVPLLAWFHTERLRMGPVAVGELVAGTEALHGKLADILGLYLSSPDGAVAAGDDFEEYLTGTGGTGHDDIDLG